MFHIVSKKSWGCLGSSIFIVIAVLTKIWKWFLVKIRLSKRKPKRKFIPKVGWERSLIYRETTGRVELCEGLRMCGGYWSELISVFNIRHLFCWLLKWKLFSGLEICLLLCLGRRNNYFWEKLFYNFWPNFLFLLWLLCWLLYFPTLKNKRSMIIFLFCLLVCG